MLARLEDSAGGLAGRLAQAEAALQRLGELPAGPLAERPVDARAGCPSVSAAAAADIGWRSAAELDVRLHEVACATELCAQSCRSLAERVAWVEGAVSEAAERDGEASRHFQDWQLYGVVREAQEELLAVQHAERRRDARLEDHEVRLASLEASVDGQVARRLLVGEQMCQGPQLKPSSASGAPECHGAAASEPRGSEAAAGAAVGPRAPPTPSTASEPRGDEPGARAGAARRAPGRFAALPAAVQLPPASGLSPATPMSPTRAADWGSAALLRLGVPAGSHASLQSPAALQIGPGSTAAAASSGGSPAAAAGARSSSASPGVASGCSPLSPGSPQRHRALVSLVEGALRQGGPGARPLSP
ncbi:unnamed protein product [Prorocentrum cordatum]|nr:unnamed protein product [Polarella glacialis]